MTNSLLRSCFPIVIRRLSMIKLKHLCVGVGLFFILDFFGVFTHIFEVSYNDNFAYPYEGDIHEFVTILRHNKKPDVPPINEYNYSFIHDISDKCSNTKSQNLRIVFLVKSAIQNIHRRMAIRNSWGFEKRFSDVPFRTVFLLGIHPDDNESRAAVNLETVRYKDIVQANFFDTYYNNTIKTMMGFKWVMNYCLNSKYYMFVDDDIYVSVRNVLRFLRNPALYPDYLKDAVKFKDLKHLKERFKRSDKSIIDPQKEDLKLDENLTIEYHKKDLELKNLRGNNSSGNETSSNLRVRRQIFDFELPDSVRLFAGFVFVSSPHRHKSSKWYVSLNEYPYHLWPPYVTAGSYILSKEALIDMYYASMYTKHFRFDDIFLGLVAKKVDIEPFHCEEFHFYKKDYTQYNYKYVISSHGYDDPDELLQVWNEQKALGNA